MIQTTVCDTEDHVLALTKKAWINHLLQKWLSRNYLVRHFHLISIDQTFKQGDKYPEMHISPAGLGFCEKIRRFVA